MSDVGDWLAGLGLAKHIDLFTEHEVDLEVLADITDEDLREIGLPLGARKKVLKATVALAAQVSESAAATDNTARKTSTGEAPKGAEHRQLTVMFCDLADSTALSTTIDAEDYRDLLSAFQDASTKAIQANNGFVARYMGDGLLAYFGYPTASEDDPVRAARAGLEVVDAIAALRSAQKLEVRVGIATGMVLVGDIIGEGASEEAAVLGSTPNLAARLQSAANPNTVLVSQTTQTLLRGQLETDEVPPLHLKGFDDTVRAFRAVRPRSLQELSAARLYTTPLVGREVELAMLERAWENVRTGEGQLLLLQGEAGIGKSRLLYGFCESIVAAERTLVEWHCSAHHQSTANYPAREHLSHTVSRQSEPTDDPRQYLSDYIAKLGLDVAGMLPAASMLAGLAGSSDALSHLSPNQIKRQLINAQVQILCALANVRPVLFTVEDVQWADPSTLEVLREIVEAIRERPVLIVVTARPEFAPPWEESSVSQLHRLHNLSRRETTSLIHNLASQHGVADELVGQIAARTDGIPLYIEELTKNLLESSDELDVPASLQDSLMARLDRLGAGRELAQAASLIGRLFTAEAVAAVVQRTPDEVTASLKPLIDAGLVRWMSSGNYEFKHALIRDSAYNSLLRRSRSELHLRFAQFLETQEPAQRQPELLARHYDEAGDTARALEYWTEAGDMAVAQGAQAEAAAHFSEAKQLYDQLPENAQDDVRELSILIRLGQAQFGALGGAAPETRASFDRAALLADKDGDLTGRMLAKYGQHVGLVISGEILDAIEISRDMLQLAEARPGSPWARLIALRQFASASYMAGRLTESEEALLEVVAAKRDMEQAPPGFAHDPYVTAHSTLSHIEWALGYPGPALRRSADNLATLTQEASNPNTVSHTLIWRMFLALFCRREDLSVGPRKQFVNHTRRSLGTFWEHIYQWVEGVCLVRAGAFDAGVPIIRQGLSDFSATGARQHFPTAYNWIAEGEIGRGNPESALKILDDSESILQETSQYFYLPETRRLRGRAWLAMGDVAQAERAFEQAIAVCQKQSARSVELRTTTDLARVMLQRGDVEQGYGRLRTLYDSLEEDQQFPDWQEARVILGELETIRA